MKPANIHAELYWSLPGPRGFITRIARHAEKARILCINLPLQPLPGIWGGVRKGLGDAHIHEVIDLSIHAGADIASEIGTHFSRRRICAEELVGLVAQQKTAIILRPGPDDLAKKNCEQYAQDFMQAIPHGQGNVHLIIGFHELDIKEDTDLGGTRIVVFDGSLSPDEMEAYVALRMLDRSGPGSTRLTRSLVSEFAGFDVDLAEHLLALDESNIVCIPSHLSSLMGEDIARWRLDSWLHRTRCLGEPGSNHVLHDQFLAQHGDEKQREDALVRIKRRYWKACVKTLTPWLEERKTIVVDTFKSQIDKIAKANNGKILRPPMTPNGKFIEMDPAELEYNNITGMVKYGHLIARTLEERAAVSVCKAAKQVRDEIAHLRMPGYSEITHLIAEMDRLIPRLPIV